MIQIGWGDDEHTVAEGAYLRAMRARKWVMLGAAASLLLAHGLVKVPELEGVLRVLRTPMWSLKLTALVGLSYSTLQYLLVGVQFCATYPAILEDRLGQKQERELDENRAKIEALNRQADDYRSVMMGREDLTSTALMALRGNPGAERLEAVEHRIAIYQARSRRIMQNDLRRSQWVKLSEMLIDFIRLLTPLAAGVLATCLLVRSGLD
ncbi:MAG TPA: hypothetical protein VHW05_13435 [Phenylobacterium sp.]|jgi:hypothetical protein|nr:hypothetical protein [Phenylobacterium sp.]